MFRSFCSVLLSSVQIQFRFSSHSVLFRFSSWQQEQKVANHSVRVVIGLLLSSISKVSRSPQAQRKRPTRITTQANRRWHNLASNDANLATPASSVTCRLWIDSSWSLRGRRRHSTLSRAYRPYTRVCRGIFPHGEVIARLLPPIPCNFLDATTGTVSRPSRCLPLRSRPVQAGAGVPANLSATCIVSVEAGIRG